MDIQPIPGQAYPYKPLPDDDSIRLLVLEPGQDGEMQCSLVDTTLTEYKSDIMDHFLALSYVWGSTILSMNIWVDGNPVAITSNLFDALRHIRHPTKSIRLWVDAVCINQYDHLEKAHQVPMMWKIYAAAFRTIIYLGTPVSGISDFDDDLGLLAYSTMEPASLKLQLQLCNTLLVKSWFRRVWVFQELVSSHDPLVQYGNFRLHWDELCTILTGNKPSATSEASIETGDRTEETRPLLFDRLSDDARKGYNLFLAMQNARTSKRQGYRALETSMFDLLRSRDGLEATDPRDMLFAHAGIASDGSHPSLKVDYTKPYVQLFEDFAMYQIGKSGDFGVLSYVNHTSGTRPAGIATWAPDWTNTHIRMNVDDTFRVCLGHGDHHPLFRNQSANVYHQAPIAAIGQSAISCRARFVGVITHVSSPLSGAKIEQSKRERFTSKLRDLRQRCRECFGLDTSEDWIEENSVNSRKKLRFRSDVGEELWDKFMAEFTCLYTEIYNTWREFVDSDEVLPPLIRDLDDSDDEIPRFDLFAVSLFYLDTGRASWPSDMRQRYVRCKRRTTDILVKYFLPEFDKKAVDGKVLALSRLKHHYLMLGPESAHVGDSVFVPYPAPANLDDLYYVMRPVPHISQGHKFDQKAKSSLVRKQGMDFIEIEPDYSNWDIGVRSPGPYQRSPRKRISRVDDLSVLNCSVVGNISSNMLGHFSSRWLGGKGSDSCVMILHEGRQVANPWEVDSMLHHPLVHQARKAYERKQFASCVLVLH